MSFTPIVRLGNPILRTPSQAIPKEEITSEAIQSLIRDLYDHMRHYQGVGIAAPQIGVNKQVFVYGFDSNPRYPDEGPVPLTTMINPQVLNYSEQKLERYEGCLSLRGLRGNVPRAAEITISGFDEHGQGFERTISGFEARIVQHELDHLNGLVFVDRVADLTTFGFTEELQASGVVD